jgi:hypothetical protein
MPIEGNEKRGLFLESKLLQEEASILTRKCISPITTSTRRSRNGELPVSLKQSFWGFSGSNQMDELLGVDSLSTDYYFQFSKRSLNR